MARKAFKNVLNLIPESSSFGQHGDYTWEQGRIVESKIPTNEEDDFSRGFLAPGLIDIWSFGGEPGHEQRETMSTLASAAKAGGYGTVAFMPDVKPYRTSKEFLQSILQRRHNYQTQLFPYVPLSKGLDTEDLNELIDLSQTGLRLFSDGVFHKKNSEYYIRVLEYLKAISGVLVVNVIDETSLMHGMVNRSRISASMGLTGHDRWKEIDFVQKMIELVDYTDSMIHLANISCEESIELIANAKKKGLKITSSVSMMNLVWTEEKMQTFDEAFKVNPPLREERDRSALIAGVKSGVLDFVNSNHRPTTIEEKKLEFAYAEFGSSTIQAAWPELLTKGVFTPEEMVKIGYERPKAYLEGLGLTVDPCAFIWSTEEWTYDRRSNESRSLQSAYIDASFGYLPSRVD